MASESSSAVLDLNDDTDTEAPSISAANDADAVPLIMEDGQDIVVKVDAPMKQLSTLETFVTYRVRCVCARWPTPRFVRRRYNHFKVLHSRLAAAHPLFAVPSLPPLHSARQQLDRYSPSFVAVRTVALDVFINRVAKHPILTHNDDFRIFLTTPDDEIDRVFRSENNALNLWGLSAALYGGNDSKPSNGPRVKDPEFTSAVDYLQSLQQKLTTLCALTNKLCKGTNVLGNELTGMKKVCDAWACSERGDVAAVVVACGNGAGGAARPRLVRGCEVRHKAALPLLATYAAAHVDKIKQRDAMHAAYVSGNNATGDVHNRLEQASEALRSELSDWLPKTRSEIKSLLLEIANRQVNIHTQSLMSWEHALKMSSEVNIDEVFKTVSKTGVTNMSPTRSGVVSPVEVSGDESDIVDDESLGRELRSTDRVEDLNHKSEETQNSDEKPEILDPASTIESSISNVSKPFSDPLQEFSDVDLSS